MAFSAEQIEAYRKEMEERRRLDAISTRKYTEELIAEQEKEIAEQKQEIAANMQEIAAVKQEVAEKDRIIAELKAKLAAQ